MNNDASASTRPSAGQLERGGLRAGLLASAVGLVWLAAFIAPAGHATERVASPKPAVIERRVALDDVHLKSAVPPIAPTALVQPADSSHEALTPDEGDDQQREPEPDAPSAAELGVRFASSPDTLEQLNGMKLKWLTEEVDQAWSEQMRSRVVSFLEELDVEGSVEALSCRRTLCKTTLKFPKPQDAMRVAMASGNGRPDRWVDIRPHGDGILVDVYVGREREAAP